MRRLLLGSAGFCSIVLIALTCAMWSRSQDGMDWVRVTAMDRSAVFASSRAHVGAAIVVDAEHWESSNQPVRYRSFRATDLRKKFPDEFLGFGYREEHGVYFVLCPMWALMVGGFIPPIVWASQKRARSIKSSSRAYATSIS
jgi:hypothetical protein